MTDKEFRRRMNHLNAWSLIIDDLDSYTDDLKDSGEYAEMRTVITTLTKHMERILDHGEKE